MKAVIPNRVRFHSFRHCHLYTVDRNNSAKEPFFVVFYTMPSNYGHALSIKAAIQTSQDIAAILKSKKNELDIDYIEQWAVRLGSSPIWKEMLDNVS